LSSASARSDNRSSPDCPFFPLPAPSVRLVLVPVVCNSNVPRSPCFGGTCGRGTEFARPDPFPWLFVPLSLAATKLTGCLPTRDTSPRRLCTPRPSSDRSRPALEYTHALPPSYPLLYLAVPCCPVLSAHINCEGGSFFGLSFRNRTDCIVFLATHCR